MVLQKIIIFGQGQLGTAYREYFESKGLNIVSPKLDIRDETAVKQAVVQEKPDLVINVVAKTNIDWCEQNKQECFSVNTLGADVIAQVCEAAGIYLLHLSSGCVQESKTADQLNSETDPVHPLCFYSWTKVWAETLLLDRLNFGKLKVLLLRPRQLLSARISPRNALTKMLTYTKFVNTPNSCTVVEDLLWVTDELINQDATGVINLANPGVITPLEIAQMLKELVKPDMQIEKISKAQLDGMTLAKRVDCVLDLSKLKSYRIECKEIHERLAEILLDFNNNLQNERSQLVLHCTQQETLQKLSMK